MIMGSPASNLEQELRGLAFAAEWPDGVIAQVAGLATPVCFPAGRVIFREGEAEEDVYLVQSGRIALEMSVPARRTTRLMTLSTGELLGWSPLIGQPEMTATAVALDESHLLRLPGPRLLALCAQDPKFGFAVMRRAVWALSRRLTATRLQLLDLYSQTAPAIDVPRVQGESP